ncbi:hypothetical protein CN643_16775, partial [Parageobacillus yumthangensis]
MLKNYLVVLVKAPFHKHIGFLIILTVLEQIYNEAEKEISYEEYISKFFVKIGIFKLSTVG